MISRCSNADVDTILEIVNDGAEAYRGIIPADRWNEPYMSREKLLHEIADGVEFSGYTEGSDFVGVMGIQHVGSVTLIRHAYVRTTAQGRGVGGKLLSHLRGLAQGPVLIGTWADALWAIRFYEAKGFERVDHKQKERLLRTYWKIPERQVETSVVLADRAGAPIP